MDSLSLGIILEPNVVQEIGGGYSYSKTLTKAIDDYLFSENLDITFIQLYRGKKPEIIFKKPVIFIKGWILVQKNPKINVLGKRRNFIGRLMEKFYLKKKVADWLRNIIYSKVEKILRRNKIEMVYHLGPSSISLNYPTIITHWDIGHKSTYAFPELVMDRIGYIRENYYNTVISKAWMVLCESESGAKELAKFYPFFEKKIKVLPLFPSNLVSLEVSEEASNLILADKGLRIQEYFLYPAQFWSHKNHYNLIMAFKSFLNQHPDLKLVLSGADLGNKNYIQNLIKTQNLSSSVLMPGFITNEELFVLYKRALALIMPTFLGPTNMPILEAAILECPVICSDLEGHFEILGEHSIYIQPESSKSIEDGMKKVADPNFSRPEFTRKAKEYVLKSKFNLSQTLISLNSILLKIAPIRKTWGI